MATDKLQIRPLKTEPVPEETYPDLLPYEMERAEAAMTIFGRCFDEIRSKVESAKNTDGNRWGHSWRPSPVLANNDDSSTEELPDNWEPYWDKAFSGTDPILESVLADKDVILVNAEDVLALTPDILPVTEQDRADHRRLLDEAVAAVSRKPTDT